jgi:glutathione S-transferase
MVVVGGRESMMVDSSKTSVVGPEFWVKSAAKDSVVGATMSGAAVAVVCWYWRVKTKEGTKGNFCCHFQDYPIEKERVRVIEN